MKKLIKKAMKEIEENKSAYPSVETCLESEKEGFGNSKDAYFYCCEELEQDEKNIEKIREYSDIKINGDFDEFTYILCHAPNYFELKEKLQLTQEEQ